MAVLMALRETSSRVSHFSATSSRTSINERISPDALLIRIPILERTASVSFNVPSVSSPLPPNFEALTFENLAKRLLTAVPITSPLCCVVSIPTLRIPKISSCDTFARRAEFATLLKAWASSCALVALFMSSFVSLSTTEIASLADNFIPFKLDVKSLTLSLAGIIPSLLNFVEASRSSSISSVLS